MERELLVPSHAGPPGLVTTSLHQRGWNTALSHLPGCSGFPSGSTPLCLTFYLFTWSWPYNWAWKNNVAFTTHKVRVGISMGTWKDPWVPSCFGL